MIDLLLADLGVKQVADNALGFVLALHGSRHDLIESGLHAVELELTHEVEQLSSRVAPSARRLLRYGPSRNFRAGAISLTLVTGQRHFHADVNGG